MLAYKMRKAGFLKTTTKLNFSNWGSLFVNSLILSI